ncbi:formin 2,putative [Plasmodium gaboni]|uniref:Formin 2,putative n=1 Tax=Plasmodium gaboni TaxID=647221 RepID=A0ABY1UNX6_9APIC|nr:formin 2,putative [Plasmodium gaboni]
MGTMNKSFKDMNNMYMNNPSMNMVNNNIWSSERIVLPSEEYLYYINLFNLNDKFDNQYIDNKTASSFLQNSGLSISVLHTIWEYSDVENKGYLTLEDFFICCRLVAHAQSGNVINAELISIQPPCLPSFDIVRHKSFSDISNMEGSLKWKLSSKEKENYQRIFKSLDIKNEEKIEGSVLREYYMNTTNISVCELMQIWNISDLDNDGFLNLDEFFIMNKIVEVRKERIINIPLSVPVELLQSVQNKNNTFVSEDDVTFRQNADEEGGKKRESIKLSLGDILKSDLSKKKEHRGDEEEENEKLQMEYDFFELNKEDTVKSKKKFKKGKKETTHFGADEENDDEEEEEEEDDDNDDNMNNINNKDKPFFSTNFEAYEQLNNDDVNDTDELAFNNGYDKFVEGSGVDKDLNSMNEKKKKKKIKKNKKSHRKVEQNSSNDNDYEKSVDNSDDDCEVSAYSEGRKKGSSKYSIFKEKKKKEKGDKHKKKIHSKSDDNNINNNNSDHNNNHSDNNNNHSDGNRLMSDGFHLDDKKKKKDKDEEKKKKKKYSEEEKYFTRLIDFNYTDLKNYHIESKDVYKIEEINRKLEEEIKKKKIDIEKKKKQVNCLAYVYENELKKYQCLKEERRNLEFLNLCLYKDIKYKKENIKAIRNEIKEIIDDINKINIENINLNKNYNKKENEIKSTDNKRKQLKTIIDKEKHDLKKDEKNLIILKNMIDYLKKQKHRALKLQDNLKNRYDVTNSDHQMLIKNILHQQNYLNNITNKRLNIQKLKNQHILLFNSLSNQSLLLDMQNNDKQFLQNNDKKVLKNNDNIILHTNDKIRNSLPIENYVLCNGPSNHHKKYYTDKKGIPNNQNDDIKHAKKNFELFEHIKNGDSVDIFSSLEDLESVKDDEIANDMKHLENYISKDNSLKSVDNSS